MQLIKSLELLSNAAGAGGLTDAADTAQAILSKAVIA